jgi:hypothetical protein
MLTLNKWPSTFLLVCLCTTLASSQDLFDCDHTTRYARYLYDTQEYDKAANEFERVLITCDSLVVLPRLFAAYRLGGDYERLNRRLSQLFPRSAVQPAFVLLERLKLAFLTERYIQVDSMLKSPATLPVDTVYYRLKHQALTNQWQQVGNQLARLDTTLLPTHLDWSKLIQQGEQNKAKKTLLAASLSTLVPGLGKVYARDWKDGLVSFLFVGGLAYQSYRAFHRRPGGPAGWAYAMVGAGFYIGNIYGSYKSARQYNQRRLARLHNEAKRLSFLDF